MFPALSNAMAEPEVAAAMAEEDADEASSGVDGWKGIPLAEQVSFSEAWDNWVQLSKTIEWFVEFPELQKKKDDDGELLLQSVEDMDPIDDMLTLDMLPMYARLMKDKDAFESYGFLPHLAMCYVGGNLASSFCERVNSAAKAIMTHDRTVLEHEHLEMLTVLRINRDFIYHCRHHHSEWFLEWLEEQKKALYEPENNTA